MIYAALEKELDDLYLEGLSLPKKKALWKATVDVLNVAANFLYTTGKPLSSTVIGTIAEALSPVTTDTDDTEDTAPPTSDKAKQSPNFN
jgi:hypothetical protein